MKVVFSKYAQLELEEAVHFYELTHDFCYKFGKILPPCDRAGMRWPICVMDFM